MKRWVIFCFVCVFVVLCAMHSWAVDPFDNWASPEGWYFINYPFFYSADEYTDKNGDTLMSDFDMKMYQNIFRICYYNKTLLPNTWVLSAFIPYTKLEVLDDDAAGIGDLTLVGGYFFKEDQATKTYLGSGLYLDAPTGSYDENKTANVGENVWRIRPFLGFAKMFGPVDFEMTMKYNISTENSDSKIKEGNEFIFESYAGSFLSRKFLLGAHINYISQGDSEYDGTKLADSSSQRWQAGPMFLFSQSEEISVMLQILQDFATTNSPEGTLFMTRICWKFD
ncbi:MAG: transporter [bacterium]